MDVRTADPALKETLFNMRVRWSGWPLPVLEQKKLWWDWDDPNLTGSVLTDHDPPIRLMPVGFILNPIIVGGSIWLLAVAIFFLTVIRRRAKRSRRGLCLKCGYDLAGLLSEPESNALTCPECGMAHDEIVGHQA